MQSEKAKVWHELVELVRDAIADDRFGYKNEADIAWKKVEDFLEKAFGDFRMKE